MIRQNYINKIYECAWSTRLHQMLEQSTTVLFGTLWLRLFFLKELGRSWIGTQKWFKIACIPKRIPNLKCSFLEIKWRNINEVEGFFKCYFRKPQRFAQIAVTKYLLWPDSAKYIFTTPFVLQETLKSKLLNLSQLSKDFLVLFIFEF